MLSMVIQNIIIQSSLHLKDSGDWLAVTPLSLLSEITENLVECCYEIVFPFPMFLSFAVSSILIVTGCC